MTVIIQLTRGQETVISDEDADLAGLKWSASFRDRYGSGGKYIAQRKGKGQMIPLHRVVLTRMIGRELAKGEFVDHVDGDPLNNTRENLRLATCSQNSANRGKQQNNTVGFKGVTFFKGKYVAAIACNHRKIYLGRFSTPELAHAAYCKAAREFFGEFARFE